MRIRSSLPLNVSSKYLLQLCLASSVAAGLAACANDDVAAPVAPAVAAAPPSSDALAASGPAGVGLVSGRWEARGASDDAAVRALFAQKPAFFGQGGAQDLVLRDRRQGLAGSYLR